MNLKESLLQFIREQLASGADAASITETEPLIDRNIIDSMALMQLVAFIEEHTTVRIPDDEVLPENFNTVEAIDAMVQRLRARR
jgi:acyl carrier protein